jgi:hypothetical protein
MDESREQIPLVSVLEVEYNPYIGHICQADNRVKKERIEGRTDDAI